MPWLRLVHNDDDKGQKNVKRWEEKESHCKGDFGSLMPGLDIEEHFM